MNKLFVETKIRMVMKLKKLSHNAAIKEVARMEAEKRKAAEEERTRAAAVLARLEEDRGGVRRRRGRSVDISRDGEDEYVPAEEFFGKID